jgi:hypothetical protein
MYPAQRPYLQVYGVRPDQGGEQNEEQRLEKIQRYFINAL